MRKRIWWWWYRTQILYVTVGPQHPTGRYKNAVEEIGTVLYLLLGSGTAGGFEGMRLLNFAKKKKQI